MRNVIVCTAKLLAVRAADISAEGRLYSRDTQTEISHICRAYHINSVVYSLLLKELKSIPLEKLSEGGFSSLLSDVSIIKIPHEVGSLQELLKIIDKNGVNIEYMYGLSVKSNDAFIVLKASDGKKVDEILTANGVGTVSCKELASI